MVIPQDLVTLTRDELSYLTLKLDGFEGDNATLMVEIKKA